MKIKELLLLVGGLCLSSSFLFAQSSAKELRKQPQKGTLYTKELSGDIRLHTNGYAIGVNYGLLKTYYRSQIFQFEITELKHPREYLDRIEFVPIQSGGTPRGFTFGKQNSFFAAHFGYGEKRYFSEKARKRGVAIGMSYIIGPSLGLLKPYYIEVYNNSGIAVKQKYTEETASTFLNRGAIAGGAGFGTGLSETSIIPGGHAKVGLHLDWGAFDEFVKAIDVGIMVDFYTKEVPIMVTEDNSALFVNLYLTLQLGKRW